MRKNKIVKMTSAVARAAGCAAAVLVSGSTYAQTTYEWNTTSGGNWNDALNWTATAGPGATFPVAGDIAIIDAAGAEGDKTITLNGNQAAADLLVNNTGITTILPTINNQTLTLTNSLVNSNALTNIGSTTSGQTVLTTVSGTVNITNNAASLLSFLTNAASGTVMQGGAGANTLNLGGTGNITFAGSIKPGAGSVALNVTMASNTPIVELAGSASTFSGITVNSGRFNIRSANALGTSATTLTANGGFIAAGNAARNMNAAIALNITGNTTFGGTSSGGTLTFNGPITVGSNFAVQSEALVLNNAVALTAQRTIVTSASTTFGGAVTGTFGITKTGSSKLVFLGNPVTGSTGTPGLVTYSGPTNLVNGTLTFGIDTIGGNGMNSPNSPFFVNAGATLELHRSSATTLASLGDYLGAGGDVRMGDLGANSLNVGGDNSSTTFSGRFWGSARNNTAAITKAGSGTMTLTGVDTSVNAIVNLNAGTLAVRSLKDGGLARTVTGVASFNTATVDDPTGIQVGMVLNFGNAASGTNIDNNNLITGISGNTLTLTKTFGTGTTVTTAAAATIGFPNSIGVATNAAAKMNFNGGTFAYIGDGTPDANGPTNTTDHLFTITTVGGVISADGASNAAVSFTNPGAIAFTGTGPRTLVLAGASTGDNTLTPILGDGGGASALTKNGTGKWILAGANTYTGATTVNGGILAVTADQVGSSNVDVTAGTLELSHTTGVDANGTVVKTGGITIAGTGAKIDVKNNKMVTTDSVSATIDKVQLGQGTFVGAQPQWNGDGGITTSETDATTSLLTTVAVASNADLGKTTFGGVSVGASDTLLMYTYGGDANLSGNIDADDYFQIDSNYNKALDPQKQYFQGDFNYDGVINGDDFAIIDANYAASNSNPINPAAPAGGVTAVPEPASIGLLLVAGAGLLRRRRRSN